MIGCLPISVDNTLYNDVETCYGDSTGSIQILATGGFGSPWTYSIDNGLTSSDIPFFNDLPAGDYQVVVVDQEGCAQTGPLVSLAQPDSLWAEILLVDSIYDRTIGLTPGILTVVANGGTAPHTFQLIPGGSPQGDGGYSFNPGEEGKYVVAVNDLNGCGPAETDTVEVLLVTGINDFSDQEVSIYPNPTSGILTLEIPFDKDETYLEVINMTGQRVHQQKIYPSSGMINETIDLSKVPKGLYLLRIDGRSLKSAIVVK